MTTTNNTEIELYHQLMSVNKCIEALKDIYKNIPEDERYASVFSVVGDRLSLEFNKLMPMILSSATDEQAICGTKIEQKKMINNSEKKCLCQDCLKVYSYTDARHNEDEFCSCGGQLCGCLSCNEKSIVFINIKSKPDRIKLFNELTSMIG